MPGSKGGWLGNELSLPDKAAFMGNPLGGKLIGFFVCTRAERRTWLSGTAGCIYRPRADYAAKD